MRFQDKVVLVTGAARGMGRNHCLRFAKEGADLVISDIASNPSGLMSKQNMASNKELEEVYAEVHNIGRSALLVKCDVGKGEDVRNMIDKAMNEYGKIDVLVNNAGFQTHSSIEDMSEESFDSVINVNLKGTFLTSKYILPHMKKRKYGKIVNISSTAGLRGFANSAHYCAAKAGVIKFTESLAVESAPWNINVNAIAPGAVPTTFLRGLADSLGLDYKKWFNDEIVAKYHLFKTAVDPQSISNMVLYLSSDDAKDMTGQVVGIDQGTLIH